MEVRVTNTYRRSRYTLAGTKFCRSDNLRYLVASGLAVNDGVDPSPGNSHGCSVDSWGACSPTSHTTRTKSAPCLHTKNNKLSACVYLEYDRRRALGSKTPPRRHLRDIICTGTRVGSTFSLNNTSKYAFFL